MAVEGYWEKVTAFIRIRSPAPTLLSPHMLWEHFPFEGKGFFFSFVDDIGQEEID